MQNIESLINSELTTKFDLHFTAPEGAVYSYVAVELLDPEHMRRFIYEYAPLIKALDDTAVGAYFAGWFTSAALALQYSLSVFDAAPDLSLNNLHIHLIPAAGYCRVAFSLQKGELNPAPNEPFKREEWLLQILTDFYKNTASPLLQCVSEASGLSLSKVWGQLPTKFNYYLELFTSGRTGDSHVKQLSDDYTALKTKLPPEAFGLSNNPFHVKIRIIEDLADPQRTTQMRNRCCLYYRTEGGSYCYTCPRLKEEERAELRKEDRGKVADNSISK
ncbi:(2Fe-2S)-binding protein [Paenibacillus sp. sgz500958]|uniref:(2Fe-2S)-binding protein n=1 Tax=Paenibacillus sp. sgz500958 TaxID=3242475 RepID=UPI0036D3870B